MLCLICSEPAGFHSGRCYAYEPTEGMAGPGNSKEFMVWLRTRPTGK